MLVHLKTLGCRLNEAELEIWAQDFQKAGHEITRDAKSADLIVLNSCAVTGEAARKSQQSIRRLHRNNPVAKLIVSGCYATLNPDQAAQSLGVDMVIGNKDKNQLAKLVLNELNPDTMPAMSTAPGESSLFSRGRQRAFVKVQDGCRYRCTFCIVTIARGEETSRTISSIVDEINTLQQQDIKEIILTGVHLGGYGHDINSNLKELIQSIIDDTQIPRIRLGSLEPWDLPDHFFQLFENSRLQPHLHLPLQSGSDFILRQMARRCKTVEFSRIVEQAHCIPEFNLTTDIIVGFPGETEEEWKKSFDYIEQTGFGHIHIFTYSPRQGTKAATLPNQVNNEIKKNRSRQLHDLAAQMKQKRQKLNLGKIYPILWETATQTSENGNSLVFGYTPNYLRVCTRVPPHLQMTNTIQPAILLDIKDKIIHSKLVERFSKITAT